TVRIHHELLRAALLTQLDAGMRLHASAHAPLELGSRLCVRIEAEITLREWIVARPFHSKVQSRAYWNGARRGEVTVEAGEQLAQRVLPAGEERMDVFALWNARTVLRMPRQRVAFQHHHPLEMIRQRAGDSQSTHSSAEHQSLSSDPVRHRTLRHGVMM